MTELDGLGFVFYTFEHWVKYGALLVDAGLIDVGHGLTTCLSFLWLFCSRPVVELGTLGDFFFFFFKKIEGSNHDEGGLTMVSPKFEKRSDETKTQSDLTIELRTLVFTVNRQEETHDD